MKMGDKDLPLLSNIQEIRARHYLLHLKTDVISKQIQGTVFIFLEPTTSCEKKGKCCIGECFCSGEERKEETLNDVRNMDAFKKRFMADEQLVDTKIGSSDEEFKVILDCCDISVISVSEIICEETKISKYLDPKFHRKCRFALNVWSKKQQLPLNYVVDPWSVKIWKNGVKNVKDFPKVICIKYETLPEGKSLLWRKDQDGHPCVFTAAAAINNRSLLPCQDPPSAMATWQAWITLPKEYYVSMTGDEEAVKFSGCIQNYKELLIKDNLDVEEFHIKEHLQEICTLQSEMEADVLNVCFYYHTAMVLPIATIAIAIGQWCTETIVPLKSSVAINEPIAHVARPSASCKHYEYPCHFQTEYWTKETHISVVYPSSFSQKINSLISFTPFALLASHKLLGTYPCQRLEIVILPRSFASLGLASPNLIFLSPTMVIDDPAAHIRLAHEISHAWFGINIGAQDWTEEWLSEGFATYMEDSIYAQAVLIKKDHEVDHIQNIMCMETSENSRNDGNLQKSEYGCSTNHKSEIKVNSTLVNNTKDYEKKITESTSLSFTVRPQHQLEELSDLRAYIRYRTLTSELENSSEDLQTLRPMQGESLVDDRGISYVKDGINPEKTYLQVHYLKGYFLLKFLSHVIGRKRFDSIIKDYVSTYHGQLVLSEHVLNFIFNSYPEASKKGLNCNRLYEDWLHYPGLNSNMTQMYGKVSNSLISVVEQHLKFWLGIGKVQRKQISKKVRIELDDFAYPDQLVLLFEYILELPKFSCGALRQIYEYYDVTSQNGDVRHRWCELVIKHNFSDLKEVKRFLIEDQAMGVYLYGELMISRRKKHKQLAEEVFRMVEKEMDENGRLTVSAMLYGE